jgi:HK97 family phage major capsid protein
MRFDAQVLTDLVTEESRLTGEVQTVSEAMNDLNATDEWDEVKLNKYASLNVRHAQLTRERDSVRAQRERYEGLTPATREAQQGPIARYLRGGADALAAEEREQFHEGDDWQAEQIAGAGDSMIIRAPQAATASDAASGQEAVEEEVPPRIIDTLTYYGGVARMVQHIMTGTGGDYRMMQMDADAQEGEILGAQDTAVTALDVPDIGVIVFGSKTYSSKPIILTREMIQDSVFDIQGYVERQALRRIGRISNKAFTITQAGSGLPQGIVNGAAAGITAASATAIAWTETVDLVYSLDRAYREMGEGGEGAFMPEGGGMIGYMISDDAEKVLRVLVDTDARPLWLPSVREGTPDRYNGYPVIVNGSMADVATGNVPMLFGNFSYYGIRTVRAFELFRFMDSRTMQKNTVECLAFARRDARFMGPTAAIRKLTMA